MIWSGKTWEVWKEVMQLHFGSVTGVGWCAGADRPGERCSSPVSKRPESEQAPEWPQYREMSSWWNLYDWVRLAMWGEKASWLSRTTQRFCAVTDREIWELSWELHLQGCIACQCCWDYVSADELPLVARCLPNLLRTVQEHECLREERRG